jgi:hypothetical protein
VGRGATRELLVVFEYESMTVQEGAARKGAHSMASIEKRIVDIPAGHATRRERDAAVERWLREEVVPAHKKMAVEPSSGIDAKRAFDELRAHHAAKTKGKA